MYCISISDDVSVRVYVHCILYHTYMHAHMTYEGTAMISGLGTSPIHFPWPGFEKKQLFHLRADLPHSWVFPFFLLFEQLCRRNRNPSTFENHVFLREMLKWYCPTPPNFFSDGQMLSFFGCNRRAELDNMGL